ncbi:hypothetical protein PFISCL1PPCAC_26027, partial [Pristionchus fissidentatus]
FPVARMVVTTRRSLSTRSTAPPVNESPTKQRVYPVLSEVEGSEEEPDTMEDDHEESSTTHRTERLKSRGVSREHSFNSSSSSFNTSTTTASEFPYGYAFLGLIVFCIVGVLLQFLLGAKSIAEPTRTEYGKLLGTVLKAYPTVSARDRTQLRIAADRWFDNSTVDPVVVVIYAPAASAHLLDDLTTTTGSLLGRKTTVVSSTPGTQRAHLHATLDNTLKGGSKSTIGLRAIEKLSWDVPLVLQSFADADHVVKSRPLIWLQVTRDDSLKGLSCDVAIEETLTSSWLASGGTVDNVAPVISRILQFTVCLDWNN